MYKIISFLFQNKKQVIKTAINAFIIALVFIFMITSISFWKKAGKNQDMSTDLNRSISIQKEQIESLENQLFKNEKLFINLNNIVSDQSYAIDFIKIPNITMVKLHDYKNKLMDQGKILLDKPNKKAVLLAKNLDRLPKGQSYQVWAVISINPTSIGLFNTDENGNAILRIEYLPSPQKIKRFIVTQEPKEGSSEPTGDMHLLGSM